MTITIYHNPACGTSRNVLAQIRASGREPVIIQYLKTLLRGGTSRRVSLPHGHRGARLLRRKDADNMMNWADDPALTMNNFSTPWTATSHP